MNDDLQDIIDAYTEHVLNDLEGPFENLDARTRTFVAFCAHGVLDNVESFHVTEPNYRNLVDIYNKFSAPVACAHRAKYITDSGLSCEEHVGHLTSAAMTDGRHIFMVHKLHSQSANLKESCSYGHGE